MPWEKQFDEHAVLNRALDAFWAKGYEATSMQDLVDCTGVNRGSLYATFGDKRSLFLAALKIYDDARRRMLSEFEARYKTRDAIRHVFQSFISDVNEACGNKGCFLTNTALELAAHDKEVRTIVAAAQEDVEAYFARIIRKGKADGEISEDVKVAETARGLLASLLGILVLIRSRPERVLLRTIVDDAMKRLD